MPTATPIPVNDSGPFSAVFDYKDEAAKEEAMKKQLQESQQKIIRTNAVGDALRLLTEGVGGSMGATITPKSVNPGILKAVDRYHDIDKESEGNLRRLKLTDLALKEKDVSDKLSTEKEAEQRGFVINQQGASQGFELEKQKKVQNFQKEMEDLNAKHSMELQGARTEAQKAVMELRYQGELDKITVKAQQDISKVGGFYAARYDNPFINEPLNRDTVIGMFGDLKKYLGDQKIYRTRWPKVLQEINKGKISNDDLGILVSEYKEFFGQRLPQLYGKPAVPYVTPTDPGNLGVLKNLVGYPAQGGYTDPAPQVAQGGEFQLKPDQLSIIQNVVDASGYSKEQKRSAVYDYLIKQGTVADKAKAFAEYMYDNLQ